MTSVEEILDAHRPRNTAHHVGRNLADGYTTVQCECQDPSALFMTQEAWVMHLVVALAALPPTTQVEEIDKDTILIQRHREPRLHGIWVRAAAETDVKERRMDVLTVIIVGAVCLAVGFLVGRVGRWVQVTQIEARLRALGLAARVAEDMGDPLPAEWVANEIEHVLGNELRV